MAVNDDAGLPANHLKLDFLAGHMPRLETLHLSNHPLAPSAGVPVPFVSKWGHAPEEVHEHARGGSGGGTGSVVLQ